MWHSGDVQAGFPTAPETAQGFDIVQRGNEGQWELVEKTQLMYIKDGKAIIFVINHKYARKTA